jgi:hypothetical protein
MCKNEPKGPQSVPGKLGNMPEGNGRVALADSPQGDSMLSPERILAAEEEQFLLKEGRNRPVLPQNSPDQKDADFLRLTDAENPHEVKDTWTQGVNESLATGAGAWPMVP